jgi:hypothetical protein
MRKLDEKKFEDMLAVALENQPNKQLLKGPLMDVVRAAYKDGCSAGWDWGAEWDW